METETSNLFQAIGAGATALTFLAGLVLYRADSNQKRNDLLTDQAILSLTRAWEVFTENGKASRPNSNRVIWLTTARHLERYKRLRSLMRRPRAHSVVLNEHEEYWRYRFYSFINPIALDHDFYTRESPNSEEIEPRSAYIIVKFAGWGNEKDPIDSVTFSENDLSDFMFRKHRFLSSYLRDYLRQSLGQDRTATKKSHT